MKSILLTVATLLFAQLGHAQCEKLDFVGGTIVANNTEVYRAACTKQTEAGCVSAQLYRIKNSEGKSICKLMGDRQFSLSEIKKNKKNRKKFARKTIYWTSGPWDTFLVGHPYRNVRENYRTNKTSLPASVVIDTILLPVSVPVGIVTGIMAWKTKSKYKKLLEVLIGKRETVQLKYYVEFYGVTKELARYFPVK